jgi:hypothetical protein
MARVLLDGEVLNEGAVIAVVAPDQDFWLACTTTEMCESNARIQVIWLEECSPTTKRQTVQNRIADAVMYKVAKGWEGSFVWRDNILCDISESATSSNNIWSIPKSTLHSINLLLQQETTTMETSDDKSSQAVEPEDLTISVHVLQQLMIRCGQGIEKVSAYYFLCIFARRGNSSLPLILR